MVMPAMAASFLISYSVGVLSVSFIQCLVLILVYTFT